MTQVCILDHYKTANSIKWKREKSELGAVLAFSIIVPY